MKVLADYIGINSLSLDLVRIAYYGTFHHAGVHVDGVLHFCRANPVATHIQNIIHPACDAVISIFIPYCSIPRKVEVFIRGEIIQLAAFMVTISGADDCRPGGL